MQANVNRVKLWLSLWRTVAICIAMGKNGAVELRPIHKAEFPMSTVDQNLESFRTRAKLLEASRHLGVTFGVTVLVLLAAMWADLIWEMPTALRWSITRVGPFIALMVWGILSFSTMRRITARAMASMVDQRASTGGEILSGWQLERTPPPNESSLTYGFSQMAIAHAGERLKALDPRVLIPSDRTRKAWVVCAGCMLVLGIMTAALPSIAWNQWQRFLFPASDIPPFTGVMIELEPLNPTVKYGDDLTVYASSNGTAGERMQLHITRENGMTQILPMLSQSIGRYQVVLTRVTEPVTLIAKSGRSRSAASRLSVTMTPEIETTRVRITPPAYTKRAVYEGAIPQDGIVGLKETEVAFSIRSNRPLKNGSMRILYRDETSESLSLNVSQDSNDNFALQTVVGKFQLSKPGRFSIRVTDTDDVESDDVVEGILHITIDQRPVVRIIEPRPFSIATPTIQLPIQIAAEDDYGITSLRLYRSLNGSPATFQPFSVDGAARQLISIELPLNKYGLQPGDELQFFARAEDNDPASPKGTESPATVVRIISDQEFQQMVVEREGADSMTAKFEAAQRHLENLSEAMREAEEKTKAALEDPDNAEAAEAARAAIEKAEQMAKTASEQIGELAKNKLPIDVDQELSKNLEQIAQSAQQMAEQMHAMQDEIKENGKPSEKSLETLAKLSQQVKGQRDEIQEQAIDPLETMQATLPLMNDQDRMSQLAQQQRELANRMESLKKSNPKNDEQLTRRIAELEDQQQQLRQELQNLIEDIEAHADSLPQEPELEKLRQTAKEFAEALKQSQASESMRDAQQKLLEDQLADAADRAAEAAKRLEDLMQEQEQNDSNMQSQGQKACEAAFNPKRGRPNLGNSLSQLRNMMNRNNRSGTRPGSQPGNGNGRDTGGYSQRTNGPQNVGMYGNVPQKRQSQSGGRGNKKSQGIATSSSGRSADTQSALSESTSNASASGQSANAVPSHYRAKVAEYYRQLSEKLGSDPGK